jgi:hypothetical protein
MQAFEIQIETPGTRVPGGSPIGLAAISDLDVQPRHLMDGILRESFELICPACAEELIDRRGIDPVTFSKSFRLLVQCARLKTYEALGRLAFRSTKSRTRRTNSDRACHGPP